MNGPLRNVQKRESVFDDIWNWKRKWYVASNFIFLLRFAMDLITYNNIQCQWDQATKLSSLVVEWNEVIYYLSPRFKMRLLLGASNIADFSENKCFGRLDDQLTSGYLRNKNVK